MSLTVDAELRELIDAVKQKSNCATASRAIRWAMITSLKEPPSATLAFDIVKWAEGLEFTNDREQRELRALVRRMYDLLT